MVRYATVDEYLSMAVKTVYQMNIEENKDALLKELDAGKLFYFCFNYRADYEGDDAFLISSAGEVFAITGKLAELEFIGLEDNEQELVPEAEEAPAAEEEDLDFAMF